MENPRNKLQDYVQQRRLSLPRYSARRVGGSDHAPLWVAQVRLHNGTLHEGKVCGSKKEAHLSASQVALEYVEQQQQQQQQQQQLPEEVVTTVETRPHCESFLYPPRRDDQDWRRVLLVDFENLPRLVREMSTLERQAMTRIYVFVGAYHHNATLALPEGVCRVLAGSAQRDGTDCCMQVYVGYLLAHEAFDEYLVATGDRFGAPLVEMIQSTMSLWKRARAHLITRHEQIVAVLQ